ncbi:YolD-like protein [Halobacillus dabanensis]|uniref:YolD-like protein n=1 Tax=Halobacillus dabanensis TaxID=240302 RepID=A0A1I3UHW6_HALDA|nr:YolD-like family protein [Halobacillus dabanensis]SFJ82522.1 YolD-like protein [Halobacillus dabanensis]
MLPEHVEMIKQVWKEDERIEKPILDKQKAEEIEFALKLAIKDDLTINIQYHNGFDFSYIKVKIDSIDPNTRKGDA